LPNVYCFHEALNGTHSHEAFYRKMTAIPGRVGNSDSGLMFTDFQMVFLGSPTLIVERDIDEVYLSLCNQLGKELCEEGEAYAFLKEQKARLDRLSGLRVPFWDIDERMEEIHDHLRIPYNQEEAERWCRKNVQVKQLMADLQSFDYWVGGA
jgi:hypothetical protein